MVNNENQETEISILLDTAKERLDSDEVMAAAIVLVCEDEVRTSFLAGEHGLALISGLERVKARILHGVHWTDREDVSKRGKRRDNHG